MAGDGRIRVGILGVGIGEVHAKAFRDLPGVDLVAVCSRRRSRAEALAATYGIPRVYEDAAGLIGSDLDVVVVATPNREHYPMTMAALAAGRHVLCEKPLAAEVEEAREMVAAAEQAGLRLAVHMNRRMQPGVVAIRRAFDRGDLGEIDHVRVTWLRQRGIPAREGFLTRARAGGGSLIDLGVHMVDQALFVQGFPRVLEVQARVHRRYFEEDVPGMDSDVEDSAFAFLTLEGGGSVSLAISWAATHHRSEERVLEVYGSRRGARRVVLGDGEEDRMFSIHERDGDAVDSGTPRLAVPSVQADLVAAIREDREPVCSGRQGLVLMEVLDALYRSAVAGRSVPVGDRPTGVVGGDGSGFGTLPGPRSGPALALALGLLGAAPAAACTPVPPLTMLFVGGTTAAALGGPVSKALVLAVVVKSAAFCLRPLPWSRASAFARMGAANLFSSVFGLLYLIFLLAPVTLLVIFPIQLFLVAIAVRALAEVTHDRYPIGAAGWTALLGMLLIAGFGLLLVSQRILSGELELGLASYWLLKWGSTTASLALGIAVTTALETSVLLLRTGLPLADRKAVAAAALRANLVTFLVLALIGAVAVLPQRFASPTGLISG